MKSISLHILQSVPVTCLNRDDLGSPKTGVFGGVKRARVSSQCWKRPIREFAKEAEASEYFQGQRTRLIIKEFEKSLVSLGESVVVAKLLAKAAGHYLAKLDAKPGEEDTDGTPKVLVKTMMMLSPFEYKTIAEILHGLSEESKAKLTDAVSRADV